MEPKIRKIKITSHSKTDISNNETDPMYESQVAGYYSYSPDKIRLEFSDNGQTTVLTATNELVTVHSEGELSTSLAFGENEHYGGIYRTSEGVIQVTTYASRIERALDDNGGSISIHYNISFGGSVVDECIITYLVEGE